MKLLISNAVGGNESATEISNKRSSSVAVDDRARCASSAMLEMRGDDDAASACMGAVGSELTMS